MASKKNKKKKKKNASPRPEEKPSPKREKEKTPLARDLLVAALSGVMVYMASHPLDVKPLAFVGYVPLLALVLGRTMRRAAFAGYVFGFVCYGLSAFWVRHVHPAAMIPMAAVLGLYTMVFALFVAGIRTRFRSILFLAVPAGWVAVEWLRSNLSVLSFHWFTTGHAFAEWLPFIQIADVTGIYGVSFVVMTVNWVLLEAGYAVLRGGRPPVGKTVYAAMLLAAVLGYGFWRMNAVETVPGPKLLAVQGNVPQSVKELATLEDKEVIFRDHLELSRPFFTDNSIDMVVWPETMVPWRVESEPWLTGYLSNMAARTGRAVFVGSQELRLDEHSIYGYNSAYFFDRSGRMAGRYRKTFLVPIGEYIPLVGVLPVFPKLFSFFTPYGVSGFHSGDNLTVFDLDDRKFGCLICFEVSAADLVRELKRDGCDFILNLSNDAWFRTSAELDMSRAQGIIRAVESRIAVVRVVNAGITSFIDPLGRAEDLVVGGKTKQVSGHLAREVPVTSCGSIYARVGDLFSILVLFFASALAVWAAARRARGRKSP